MMDEEGDSIQNMDIEEKGKNKRKRKFETKCNNKL